MNNIFYTGCLQSAPFFSEKKIALVCIDSTLPNGFKGVHYPKLAPPQELSIAKGKKLIDQSVFDLLFSKYLKTLDVNEVIRALRRFAPETDQVALLSGTRFDFQSHRFFVGKWLTKNGYPTQESQDNFLKFYKQTQLF